MARYFDPNSEFRTLKIGPQLGPVRHNGQISMAVARPEAGQWVSAIKRKLFHCFF